MTKIPKKLKIGAHVYKVRLVDPEDLERACGEQNYTRNTIKLRNDLSETQILSTLIHEILHAMNTELDHKIIDFLAQAFTQVLVDNKLVK